MNPHQLNVTYRFILLERRLSSFAAAPQIFVSQTVLKLQLNTVGQGDSDVFSINQNLDSLHQGNHRFSHAFFTKVLHFRDNRKNVQMC